MLFFLFSQQLSVSLSDTVSPSSSDRSCSPLSEVIITFLIRAMASKVLSWAPPASLLTSLLQTSVRTTGHVEVTHLRPGCLTSANTASPGPVSRSLSSLNILCRNNIRCCVVPSSNRKFATEQNI